MASCICCSDWFENIWYQKECCSGTGKKIWNAKKKIKNAKRNISPVVVIPTVACRSSAECFIFYVFLSGDFVGGARRCLHHNTLTAGGGNNVMFLTGEELLLLLPPPSTLLVFPPSTSSCVLKEMEILFTQSTNTHLFFDASLRRRASVGRSVLSDRLQEFVKKKKKVTQPEKQEISL